MEKRAGMRMVLRANRTRAVGLSAVHLTGVLLPLAVLLVLNGCDTSGDPAPDPQGPAFAFTPAADSLSILSTGYLDFKVTSRNMARLIQLTQDMNKLVMEGGGRFYFAKDSTLTPQVVEQYLGKATVNKFKRLKAKVDPEHILQTDLYRRCFG